MKKVKITPPTEPIVYVKPKRTPRKRKLSKTGREIEVKGDEFGPLTERQRAFVTNLVHHKMNKAASCRLAGFSDPDVTAHRLMRTPKIIRAIEEERAEYARSSGMSKKRVIDGFSEAIDLARIKGDPLAMIGGWREIGKMCGFYEATKTELKVSVGGQLLLQRINTMSDAELLQLAENDPSVLEGDFHVVKSEE